MTSSEKTPAKDLLAKAFRYLLSEKTFSKINIEDITTSAGLSRQTFYRNFYDKYDALAYIYMMDIDSVIDDNTNDIRTVAAEVLQYFKEHAYIYKEMGCDFSNPNAFLTFWLEYNFQYMQRFIGKRKMTEEINIALQLWLHGCYYIHYQYMTNKIKGTSEEISQLIIDTIPHILVPYFQL